MALDDTIATLGRTSIFELFDRDALRLIAFSAETRRLRPNEVLFREGERSDGGYIVLEGEVVATRRGSAEETAAGPGSLVGRMALFVRIQRPATAVARERSHLLRISPTLMRRVLEEFPRSAAAIWTALEDDLAGLTEDLDRVRGMLEAIGEPPPARS